jgi:hypothetical protein
MPVPLGVGIPGGLTDGRYTDPITDHPKAFHVTLSSVLYALIKVVDLGLALNSVVLPNPAGAETSVSLRSKPAFNRSIRRGRETSSGRGGGIKSLVFKSGRFIIAPAKLVDILSYVSFSLIPISVGFVLMIW